MPPHDLSVIDDVSQLGNAFIECVVSSINHKDEKLNWLEQIPNKLEKLEENAQAAWNEMEVSPMLEKLILHVQSMFEKVITYVKESSIWELPPEALVLISLGLFPIVSCFLFIFTCLSFLFMSFVAFEGTMLAIGVGVVTGMIVSAAGMGMSIIVVIAMTYFAVTKFVGFVNSMTAN